MLLLALCPNDVVEPVPVNLFSWRPPRVLGALSPYRPGDFGEAVRVSRSGRPELAFSKLVQDAAIEIANRGIGVGLPISFNKMPRIAYVFENERLGIVFRMPLKEYKEAVTVDRKNIEAGLNACDRLEAMREKFRFRQVVINGSVEPATFRECRL